MVKQQTPAIAGFIFSCWITVLFISGLTYYGMTLYDFNRGSQEDRLAWTSYYGAYLSYRYHIGHRIALYHIGEFFVEVYYQVQGNEVDYVRGFKNLEILTPYLDKIKLPDVSR